MIKPASDAQENASEAKASRKKALAGQKHRQSDKRKGKIRHRVLWLSENAIEFALIVNVRRKRFQRMQPECIVRLALCLWRFNQSPKVPVRIPSRYRDADY